MRPLAASLCALFVAAEAFAQSAYPKAFREYERAAICTLDKQAGRTGKTHFCQPFVAPVARR